MKKQENNSSRGEAKFLRELENRAHEQRKLVGTEILPPWAIGVGEWLVINPWRVLIPFSFVLYLLLRLAGGAYFRDFVLGLFGGFR
jgi:hypothetical protein